MDDNTHADVFKTGCDGMESILLNGVAYRPIGYSPFTIFRLTSVVCGHHIKSVITVFFYVSLLVDLMWEDSA